MARTEALKRHHFSIMYMLDNMSRYGDVHNSVTGGSGTHESSLPRLHRLLSSITNSILTCCIIEIPRVKPIARCID